MERQQEQEITKIYPPPAKKLQTEEIYENLSPGCKPKSRPYMMINMVSSLDGKVTLNGKASGIGSPTDRQIMRELRLIADAVMVGAGTLRTEKMDLGVTESMAEIRRKKKLREQPLILLPTNTGELPLDTNLVGLSSKDRKNIMVLVGKRVEKKPREILQQRATVIEAPSAANGDVDLNRTLEFLRQKCDIKTLVVEGGPKLNYALISNSLADELFLTLAPKLVGGYQDDSLNLIQGQILPQPENEALELISVHLAKNELFLRYEIQK